MDIISVKNLSKKYYLTHEKSVYGDSFRDALSSTVKSLFQKPITKSSKGEEFWALKDVSFDIKAGERVGIIGSNGAGKSTLLKILSRITPPTEGTITMRGRIASLLEVGTGFHPELTGRENIFLNGAILGMSRNEIQSKFDEIVAFSEVEKFLDTPVKRYSSGMYVRLAFAVAAHLEPEILVVDEVLAVGDAAFQKKCINKMQEVSRADGRTVLFVSHNMSAIQQLCEKVIVLKKGKVIFVGGVHEGIEHYMSEMLVNQSEEKDIKSVINSLPKDDNMEFEDITFEQGGRKVQGIIANGEDLNISVKYKVKQQTSGLRVFVDILDNQENLLVRSFNDALEKEIPLVEPGEYISTLTIPKDFLGTSEYIFRVYGTIFNVRNIVQDGISFKFNVERTGINNRAYFSEPIRGKVAPVWAWKVDKLK
jgi:lipopolysaccharide transport system ATP-binding protein